MLLRKVMLKTSGPSDLWRGRSKRETCDVCQAGSLAALTGSPEVFSEGFVRTNPAVGLVICVAKWSECLCQNEYITGYEASGNVCIWKVPSSNFKIDRLARTSFPWFSSVSQGNCRYSTRGLQPLPSILFPITYSVLYLSFDTKAFLRAFTKIAKTEYKLLDVWVCLFVCPSVFSHGTTRLPLDGFLFHLIYFFFFSKIGSENSSPIKIWPD
jgi:hypothetical protein